MSNWGPAYQLNIPQSPCQLHSLFFHFTQSNLKSLPTAFKTDPRHSKLHWDQTDLCEFCINAEHIQYCILLKAKSKNNFQQQPHFLHWVVATGMTHFTFNVMFTCRVEYRIKETFSEERKKREPDYWNVVQQSTQEK